MIFMIAFWITLIIAIILFFINLKLKDKKLDTLVGLLIFLQFIFIIVAIGTNDPIFEAIGLPKGYEWIAGLTLSGFSLWMFYLSPLKNRVIETEKKVESIDAKASEIKDDVSWIKSNCNVSFKK